MSINTQLIQNRYEILDKLGEGGMGAVYRVLDRLNQQEVALKTIRTDPSLLEFASKTESISERAALAREFSTLASLRHPHIISVLDYGFAGKQPFFTMTLLNNAQPITDHATDKPYDEKVQLLVQLLQALHYLHRRGITHRDLKPPNVLVTPDGRVKLMDFGLALPPRTDKQDTGIAGTLMYMAPELFQTGAATLRSDLWATGVIACEILGGVHPFDAPTEPAMLIKMMTQEADVSILHEPLRSWVARLLHRDPDKRFADAFEALHTLRLQLELPISPDSTEVRESFLQASTFVGRQTELQQLMDALGLIEATNAFFLVGGESGVGKSRLLNELRIQALVQHVMVINGQAVEGGGLPFQLWRPIMRRLLLITEVSDLQAGILKALVPDVSHILGRDIPTAPELTGQAYQQRIVLTIVDVLRRINQPLLLLLEDLQWAQQSLAPLQQILRVQAQLPTLMIVANYRDDEAPALPDTLNEMQVVRLERLDEASISALSIAMLGEAGATESIIQLLQRESEGNTLFIIETMRAFAEQSGSLERIDTRTLPDTVFTGGMQAILRRRLAKVDARYHPVQTLAAIIGREIDTRLLTQAFDEATVQAWLNNSAEYGVTAIQENQWRFAHDKLREAVVVDIPDDERPDLHRRAAETIEAVYPENADYNEALFKHWQHVGDLNKTCHYILPLANHMIIIAGAYDRAEAVLQDIIKRLPLDDVRRVAFLNLLAESSWRRGNYDLSETHATRAQQIASTHKYLPELATSFTNLGIIAWNQSDYERATDFYQQSLAIWQELGHQRGISTVLNNLGVIAGLQGDFKRAATFYQQNLATFQESGDQHGIAVSLDNLGIIAWNQGDYERAMDRIQKSLDIRQHLGDQFGIANNLMTLAIIVAAQGDYERATALHQQSLDIKQQLGDQRGIAGSLANLGTIAADQGDYEQATALHQQSLDIHQQLGDQRGIAITLINLADIAYSQEGYERATSLYQQSIIIGRRLGDQYIISHNLMGLGWLAFKLERTQALHWFSLALQTTHTIGATPDAVRTMVGLAGCLAGDGQAERAAQFVGLAQQHPANNRYIRQAIDEIMPQLEATLSPDHLQAALEHGKTLDLDTVVADLLAEFEPADDDDLNIPDGQITRTTLAARRDTVLGYAVASINPDATDEAAFTSSDALDKLSPAQRAELDRLLAEKYKDADADATLNLQDIIDAVVAMLRETPDTK